MKVKLITAFIFAITCQVLFAAEDRVELDTTVIKGNTELPKILYVVPWKDLDGKEGDQQKLRLHSLFGDIFDPVTPLAPDASAHLQKSNSSELMARPSID